MEKGYIFRLKDRQISNDKYITPKYLCGQLDSQVDKQIDEKR